MTDARATSPRASLLERAAAVYDFTSELRPAPPIMPRAPQPRAPQELAAEAPSPPLHGVARRLQPIDRQLLRESGFLVPGAPVGVLAEEFRLVKRHLLNAMRAGEEQRGGRAQVRAILVCSAHPNEGKTFCAINLALSLAAERDIEVLLIDADFAKPDVMARLGLREGQGLLDVLADPGLAIEDCVVGTDVPQLSLLPAGGRSNQDTELLASDRTRGLIDLLLAADPRRVILFDSSPALAASPAATLAQLVGQVLLVVRADKTSDTDLRETVRLLGACEQIQLVLNSVSYAPGGRRFGTYYDVEGEA